MTYQVFLLQFLVKLNDGLMRGHQVLCSGSAKKETLATGKGDC